MLATSIRPVKSILSRPINPGMCSHQVPGTFNKGHNTGAILLTKENRAGGQTDNEMEAVGK